MCNAEHQHIEMHDWPALLLLGPARALAEQHPCPALLHPRSCLQAGKAARTVELNKEEQLLIKSLGLITQKVRERGLAAVSAVLKY